MNGRGYNNRETEWPSVVFLITLVLRLCFSVSVIGTCIIFGSGNTLNHSISPGFFSLREGMYRDMHGGRPLESHHAVYVRTEELAAKLERCVSVPDSWPGQDTYALR